MLCSCVVDSPQPRTQLRTDADLAAWSKHLAPAPEEIAWESIPWRGTFREGLTDAGAAGKPLLLWLMNGHPLGCT